MARLHPLLTLGTSSWSSDDWKKAGFYPAALEPRDYLGHYAARFDAVEVDSSFYRAPSPSTCERWRQVTPAGFRFALKVPKSITHDKVLEGAEREWDDFQGAVTRLEEKLGFLVLQFPYFNRQSACPALGEFLRRLGAFAERARPPCPLVIEVRNKGWVGKDLFDGLRARKLIFAMTSQEWMPAPKEIWRKHGMEAVTGASAYLRLLGERQRIEKLTTSWDRLVIDRSGETRDAIEVIREVIAQGTGVEALFNNHFGGYAVASIELFERLWRET